MNARLDVALVAFCATYSVEEDQVKGAAIRRDLHTDKLVLSVVVDYGIAGSKNLYIPLEELEDTEFQAVEPGPATEPEPEPEPETESEPEPTVVRFGVKAEEFADIPGVSLAVANRILDAGIVTWQELDAAVLDGSLSEIDGIGEATMAKVKDYLFGEE